MMLRPHTVLGSFEILSVLGAGGMGEVYRARDRRLDREVAIKVLPDALAADPERLARFQREARVLASLNHPNIATLHGFESAVPGDREAPAAEGRAAIPFLVMEVVAGETLAEIIARGALPLEQALPIFLQIAEALESAHERGVIHRDLKPANIKVSPDGVVKLLDFGLAKAIAIQAATSEPNLSNSPTVSLAATRQGEIMGTATYMAPEQARGQAVDRRADVWAFGACLFEALVGRRAFDGDTVSDALAQILRGEPDWKALPGATPRPLLELLRRCLEKAPRERLRDVGEARIAIAKLCAGGWVESAGDERAAARSPALRRGWTWAAAGLLGGTIVGGLAVRGLRSPAPEKRSPTRFTIVAPDGERFRDLSDLAISPDGRHLVYGRARGRDTGFTRTGG